MKIILSGGGSKKETRKLDQKFASLLDKTKPLLYIPIAIDNIKHPYKECLEWLKSTFEKLKVNKYEMWTEDDLSKSKNKSPEDFSGIYIGGGNTPYLLKKLKNTGMWDFLKHTIEKNIPIYGGSAGAIIFSKTIIHSMDEDKNWVDLTNLSGMNILNGKEIACHYTKLKKNKLKKITEKNKKTTIALTNRNGIYITDEEVILIGENPAILFKDNKLTKINPGSKI